MAALGVVAVGCVASCGGSGDDTLDGSTDATTSDQESDAKSEASVDTGADVAKDVAADTTTDAIDESTQDASSDATDASADSPSESSVDAGDGGGCSSNSDCSLTDYCEKGNGNCGGTGTCVMRPTVCNNIAMPTCGCNKTTYANPCFCHAAGQTVDYIGACE